jgi:hypothetical protein
LFLAFPAIFPASATLICANARRKKACRERAAASKRPRSMLPGLRAEVSGLLLSVS